MSSFDMSRGRFWDEVSFLTKRKMPRILFVATGEAFRSQIERTDDERWNAQMSATHSQLRLFRAFPDVHWDVMINTYANPMTPPLIETYPNIVRATVHPTLLGEYGLITDTLKQLKEMDLSVYDSILFVRIDFRLRAAFTSAFRPTEDHIVYAHLDANEASGEGVGPHPGVCHNIVHVPREFFPLLCGGMVWWRHISLNLAARYTSKIRFYSNTFHSCTTANEWNPFYVMVDRPESTVFTHGDVTYDIRARRKRRANGLFRAGMPLSALGPVPRF